MLQLQRILAASLFASLLGCGATAGNSPSEPTLDGWKAFGSDKAYTRYSALDQIDAGNVDGLRAVWRRPPVDPSFLDDNPDLVVSRYLLSTPQMIDGILYASNGIGLVEAMDPGTGRTLWMQGLPAGEAPTGSSSRGLGYWSDGTDHRLFSVRGEYLYAIDRDTGEPCSDFGDTGRVSFMHSGPDALRASSRSGLVVVGDVVVLAPIRGGPGDRSRAKQRDPGNIMGFDVRTGELLWEFSLVPGEGEFGVETWGKRSWEVAGDMASWCCLSADEDLGYVYAPTSSPTGFYGGWRPGDNLFSNSLIAINAQTGQRVWHYQTIHHGISEYEPVGPPILGDITADGRTIKAVMQASKTGYLFAFDRVTGEPVWPIEERPVPQSTIPGEATSPTQPFPTKPAPFGRIGVTEDDLIDFTPELRARTVEFLSDYVLTTNLYAPPTLSSNAPGGSLGTLTVPGTYGATNWNAGAFDPETGWYYTPSHTLPGTIAVVPAETEEETIVYPRVGPSPLVGPDDLPLVKPPYASITAINMNTGEHVWRKTNGEGPRDHPLLRNLDLPPLGTPGRPVILLTKTLLFVGEGSDIIGGTRKFGGRTFRAYNKTTGEIVWEKELVAGTTSQPMTYLHEGKQYIVVPIGDSEHPAEWVALGLP